MSVRAKKKGRGPRPVRRSAPRASRVMPVLPLDPNEPGLDENTRQRRRALAVIRNMSSEEMQAVLVAAGIYTEDGQLTEWYANDEPSASRPTD
jgi:hypothetical protein